MTYEEALQQVQSLPDALHAYLQIEFHYSHAIILPYQQGLQILEAMQQGWYFKSNYNEAPEIRPVEERDVNFKIISRIEFQKIHMARLLDVKLSDLENMAEGQPPIPY